MSHDAAVRTLAEDERLARVGGVANAGGCLVVLVPGLLFVIAAVVASRGLKSDGFVTAGLVALALLFLAWGAIYLYYRALIYRTAVSLPGAGVGGDVMAGPGVIEGKPEIVFRMRTRSTAGRHGACLVELYPNGVQIWKGSQRRGPRWQFAYEDMVRAESVRLVSMGSRFAQTQHFLRLVVDRPRIAFFMGNAWLANRGVDVLAARLRDHGVPVVEELLAT